MAGCQSGGCAWGRRSPTGASECLSFSRSPDYIAGCVNPWQNSSGEEERSGGGTCQGSWEVRPFPFQLPGKDASGNAYFQNHKRATSL